VVTNTNPPLSLVCLQLPTLCFAPLTLSHPTVQITLFTWTISTISVVLVQDSACSCFLWHFLSQYKR
jgi:hypothetical protein